MKCRRGHDLSHPQSYYVINRANKNGKVYQTRQCRECKRKNYEKNSGKPTTPAFFESEEYIAVNEIIRLQIRLETENLPHWERAPIEEHIAELIKLKDGYARARTQSLGKGKHNSPRPARSPSF